MPGKQTFTGLNALGPRMRKLRVSVIATLIEPSTAAGATTESVGFLGETASGAYRSRWHCERSINANSDT